MKRVWVYAQTLDLHWGKNGGQGLGGFPPGSRRCARTHYKKRKGESLDLCKRVIFHAGIFNAMSMELLEPWDPQVDALDMMDYAAMKQESIKHNLYAMAVEQAAQDIWGAPAGSAARTEPEVGQTRFEDTGSDTHSRRRKHICIIAPGALSGEIEDVIQAVCRGCGCSGNELHVTLFETNKTPHIMRGLQRVCSHLNATYNVSFKLKFRDFTTAYTELKDNPPQLVVSELLGALGGNERMPETMRNAVRAWPQTVFIPQAHSSWAVPVESKHLDSALLSRAEGKLPQGMTAGVIGVLPALSSMQPTPTGPALELWTHCYDPRFQHDGKGLADVRRECIAPIEFARSCWWVSYFTCQLYKDVMFVALAKDLTDMLSVPTRGQDLIEEEWEPLLWYNRCSRRNAGAMKITRGVFDEKPIIGVYQASCVAMQSTESTQPVPQPAHSQPTPDVQHIPASFPTSEGSSPAARGSWRASLHLTSNSIRKVVDHVAKHIQKSEQFQRSVKFLDVYRNQDVTPAVTAKAMFAQWECAAIAFQDVDRVLDAAMLQKQGVQAMEQNIATQDLSMFNIIHFQDYGADYNQWFDLAEKLLQVSHPMLWVSYQLSPERLNECIEEDIDGFQKCYLVSQVNVDAANMTGSHRAYIYRVN